MDAPASASSKAADEVVSVGYSTAADRPEQGRLYDLSFGKQDGERALPWRYDSGPHGTPIAPIARATDGVLLSSYTCSPRRVRWRGQELCEAVGQTGDVMTHPTRRSSGIFTRLHWMAMDAARGRGWPAAWGLPNQNSGRIFFGKLDWKLAGHIGPWSFVLEPSARARAVRLQSGRLAALSTPLAALSGRWHRAKLRAHAKGLTVEPWEHYPTDVEALSSAVEPRFDWMVHRTREHLAWRFGQAPSGLFRALGVRDAAGTLASYAVVQAPRPGEPIGIVSDLVGIDPAAEAAALDAALAALHDLGAAVARAYAMAGSHWEATLCSAGFAAPRARKEVGAYALLPAHPLAAATLDTSRWYFLDGDRDDETVR
jgi:hypothetical protein